VVLKRLFFQTNNSQKVKNQLLNRQIYRLIF